MPSLNKVFLIGNLTSDPELRRASNGTAVTDLRLATSRGWTGKDGERREETLFIDVTVWDRQAENCCQYLRKGRLIHVEGYLKMETWPDKETGQTRSKIKVQAERVQFLDSQRSEGGGYGGGSMDDDMAPAPAREPGPRRGSGTMRGPSGGYGEPRGPMNGPSRSPYPNAAPSGPSHMADDGGEEDIPF